MTNITKLLFLKYYSYHIKQTPLINKTCLFVPNKLLLERLVCLWKNIRIIQASVWKIVCFKDYHFKEALFIWLKIGLKKLFLVWINMNNKSQIMRILKIRESYHGLIIYSCKNLSQSINKDSFKKRLYDTNILS